MSNGEGPSNPTFWMAGALLLAVCGFLYFVNLGEEDPASEAEARVLLTAEEMQRLDTWIVPTVAGEERWEKPPLYVWAVKLAAELRDQEITPLAGRLPGAISMTLLILLGFWWAYQHLTRYPRPDGREISPEAFALLSGLLLATSPELFKLARDGVADSTFALLCFAALYCLGQSFESRRSFYAGRPWRQWVLAAYVLAGLATVTKGPFAFLFVLLPYVATCWNYKMRRPDWIHLPGLALGLAIGCWWYALAIALHPEAKEVFLSELLRKRFGPEAEGRRPFYFYLLHAARSYFPWILPAIVMAWRNVRKRDRTPTLETWSWAFLIGLVWLSLVGTKREEYFLPVAPFILLLAGDAFARWEFDGPAGAWLRGLMDVLRWGAIAVGLPLSLLLGTDAGLVLTLAVGVVSLGFIYQRLRSPHPYAWWERTAQSATLLAMAFLAALAVYARDYIPRKALLSRNRGFIAQVKAHLPADAQLFYWGETDSALYSYHLGRLIPIVKNVNDLASRATGETYLLSDEDLKRLQEDPRLAVQLVRLGGDSMRARTALFRVMPDMEPDRAPTLEERYARLPPLRLAVLGDAGRGERSTQRDVADRLYKWHEERPFHEIIMLGEPVTGDSRLQRIDFRKTFERPYKAFFQSGVPFHGVLAERDLDIALVLTRYPPLQMAGERYYARDFYGGLVRLYALESASLADEDPTAGPQWRWLSEALAASSAPWKILALHRPLLSQARENDNSERLRERLLPLLEAHGVSLVLWADEPWYQRVHPPGGRTTFLGVGWSGRVKPTTFEPADALRATATDRPGFVVLEVSPLRLRYLAVDERGSIVDSGQIERAPALRPAEPPPATPPDP